jgi:hypothetical protein
MNQRSGTLTTFRIDPVTGIPHPAGAAVAMGTPSRMFFLSE